MSKKVIFPLIAVFGLGIAGCQASGSASANIGSTEPKAATPPPPEPPPPPAPPAAEEPPKPIKALGKAKVENNEIKIPGKVHFETNKTAIKEDKETKEILQTVADMLKENPQITKLRVEGHTDNVGGDEPNMKLSQGRAESVVEWLAKNGVDKSRLEAKGWGEHHALAANDTPANKEMNRRVEFKLWELDGKPTEAQKAEAATGTPAPAAGATTATTAAGKKDAKDAKPGDKAEPAAAGAAGKKPEGAAAAPKK